MRIVCAGGGPAGLYFAIQMKRRDPSHRIAVFERNRRDDTFGWGVVFSDETLRNLEGADPLGRRRHPGFTTQLAIKLHSRISELLQRTTLSRTMTVRASRRKDVLRVRLLHW